MSACPDCYDFDLGQLNGTYCLPATGDAANPCVWGLTLDMGVVVRPATCTASPGTFPARVTIGFRVTGGFPDALVGVVVAYDLGDGSYRGGVAMFFENGSDILDSHTCPRSATYTHAHNPAEACSSIDGTATVDLGAVC